MQNIEDALQIYTVLSELIVFYETAEILGSKNKLTSQISDLLSVLHPKKIRALSFYKDTYEEEKKAEKEGKQFYNFQVSTNIWDSDINNELLSEMQKYAEPRLKELREELRKL